MYILWRFRNCGWSIAGVVDYSGEAGARLAVLRFRGCLALGGGTDNERAQWAHPGGGERGTHDPAAAGSLEPEILVVAEQ